MRPLFLSLFFALAGCANAQRYDLQEQDLVTYEYVERGTMTQPNHDIRVAISHDSTACIIRLFNNPNYLFYKTDYSLMQEINQLVQEHKMHKYKDYYKPQFEVLDGTTWSFSAQYKSGKYLSSHGHEVWPKDDGLQLINQKVRDHIKDLKPYKTVTYTYDIEEE